MERSALLRRVAAHLAARRPGHPLRVGIDGPCGVGKTTFAGDLADALTAAGRPVVHIDSDGFHHVRAVRYKQGRTSPRGYYEDAYDLDSLRDLVLAPLGAGGSRRCATKVHDLASDAVERRWVDVPDDAVVLFAATFVQRGELRGFWDEVIHLDAPEAVAQQRGVERDTDALGGAAAAHAAYESRYTAAYRIYRVEESPAERASILIDHTDPRAPEILRGPDRRP
ncbi:MAG TPA: uridine kinase [Amnibacterium sp.]|nr:uridine kinase [Amnibacterium sp.]